MKNLFTRFLMIVFLFSVFYQAYGAGSSPNPSVNDIMLTTLDESATQAQPGTVNAQGYVSENLYSAMDDAINANAIEAIGTAPYLIFWGPTGTLDTYVDVEIMVDFFDYAKLTVKDSIHITLPNGEVIYWTPVLDNGQRASFKPDLFRGVETFGTYTVTLPEGTVVNENGLRFKGFSWTFDIIENIAPTVTVTDAPVDAMNTLNTFSVELTFSEEVKGVEEALEGSVGLDTVVTADGIVYTLTFTGDDEMEGMLELIDSLVTDVSKNANKLVGGLKWLYKIGDHVVPTAVVEPNLKANPFDIKITFSEEVIVPVGGIVVNGGTATVTNVGNVYKVSVAANDGATVKLNLTSLITDDSKNANALAAAEYTYTLGDRTAPIADVYKPAATDTIPTFDVTIAFNEQVTGVSTQSVKLAGDGSVLKLRTIVEGRAYEATITGREKTTVVLSLTNAIKDMAGNALVPVNFTYTIGDFTGSVVTANPASGNFITNMFEVTLTFDEVVTGVAGAVQVSGGTVAVTGSGMVYTAMIDAPSMSSVDLILGTTIVDMAGNTFAGATFSYNVTGLVPIATVQSNASESLHKGKILQIEGTVTGVAAGEGFFVQDAVAAWSGIWVEYANVNDDDIKVGDGVLITGEVAEIADVTTIIASNVKAMQTAMAVTEIEVTPTEAEAEMYESVLVKVNGARATSADAGSGEWTIYYVPTDNVTVNDWMYNAVPVAGHFYDVTGIVNGRLDAFKLEPRMESDVVDLTTTGVNPNYESDFKVYPNPFNNQITIDSNDKLTRVVISNIAGQRVIDIEYPNREINTANLVSGIYVISLYTEKGIAKTERMIKK